MSDAVAALLGRFWLGGDVGLELGLFGPWLVHDLLRGDVDFLAILTTPVAGRRGKTVFALLAPLLLVVVVFVGRGVPTEAVEEEEEDDDDVVRRLLPRLLLLLELLLERPLLLLLMGAGLLFG